MLKFKNNTNQNQKYMIGYALYVNIIKINIIVALWIII